MEALEVHNLTKRFERKGQEPLLAVNDVSFTVGTGECVGLVGGSGCGKSTVAKIVTRLMEPTSGSIVVHGNDVTHMRGSERRKLAQDVQMVFQNPSSSFDPRRTLADGIAEGLRNFGTGTSQARSRAVELLGRCGLSADFARRLPQDVSGGQCQRAAIARALALRPTLVVCDEATSALDVTVQRQILDLLDDMRREHGTAYLFICHDLALVQGFCDRVLVMQAGRIVEQGTAYDVTTHPTHTYTRQLLDAALC